MTTSTMLGRYWRVLLVGVLGGLIAFTGSFLVEPTYTSSTRLLIHGRDATFLTSTGQDLSGQPGVVDSTLAKTLAATYAGMATSRSVAVAVVDRLDLDAAPSGGRSLLGTVSHGLATAYRCGKAFVKSGFCATPSRHEAAVLGVQQGTSAAQVGSNAGETAGQQGSYVLEVTGSGTTRDQAKAVTDAIADELVAQSAQRFSTDAQRHVQDLQRQVDAAAEDVRTQTAAVAAYKSAHGITAADEQQVLLATSASNLRAELNRAEADLADTRAQLSSVERSLASTPADATSQQRITTGRSTTVLDTTADSQVYNELVSKQKSLKAQLTGLTARVEALRKQVNSAQPLSLNAAQAELAAMQQDVDVARANQTKLAADLQAARSSALSSTQDLSRIDQADTPTYPSAPKRYVYLALGLLLGGLAGAGLTWLARRREDDVAPSVQQEPDAADLHEVLMRRPEPVTVPEARAAETPTVVVLPPDQLSADGSSNGHAGAKHP
jgi:succinoglycan biosynthesis transport protein ExoP